jgi:A/G-specific adenine glycosylase
MDQPRLARRLLMDWYSAARRDLPWRRTRDPWHILLSEVMLQQTRVTAVIPYYERFVERYPTPADFAAAAEPDVLRLWSGLGYYSRARNLQRAARAIVEAGAFPSTYEGIARLPGVGEYTAAAVASIAFSLPHAVMDGNVIRVLSRLVAEQGDVVARSVRVRLREEAQRLLDLRRPGDFNQALMELGATICLPKNPQCLLCPWRDLCHARAGGLAETLPVKRRKRDPIALTLTLLIVEKHGRHGSKLLLRPRGRTEPRLAGFWELPEARHLPSSERLDRLGGFRHSITRNDYAVEVYAARIIKSPKDFRWFAWEDLERLPLTTTTRKALALKTGKPI